MTATATASVKDAVIDAIRQMPDDTTVEDILEALYVRQKIDVGLRDVAEGRVMSHEEAEERLFAELERRRTEHESGRDTGIPTDELFQKLRAERSTRPEEKR